MVLGAGFLAVLADYTNLQFFFDYVKCRSLQSGSCVNSFILHLINNILLNQINSQIGRLSAQTQIFAQIVTAIEIVIDSLL